jgi:hypothetical protein
MSSAQLPLYAGGGAWWAVVPAIYSENSGAWEAPYIDVSFSSWFFSIGTDRYYLIKLDSPHLGVPTSIVSAEIALDMLGLNTWPTSVHL